jgi:hypothetical protein
MSLKKAQSIPTFSKRGTPVYIYSLIRDVLYCTEMEEVIFPEEIWIIIWSYLDFKTIQKTCTRVSKSWLKMIRSSKLSWEMKLQDTIFFPKRNPGVDLLGVEDFNAILSQWQDLRELHFSSYHDFAKFRLSMNSKKSLKKIVNPNHMEIFLHPTSVVTGYWVDVAQLKTPTPANKIKKYITGYWIDPKHLLTPTDEIKNVIKLRFDVKGIPEEFAMRQNDWDFENLESLAICENNDGGISSNNVIPMLLRFQHLKKIEIDYLEIHINYLLDILRFLGNMKLLNISVNLGVINEFDEEATKNIFNEALEIVNEKFPFPDVRILELKILEKFLDDRQPRHSIIYGQSGPFLDNEYETSDFESDISDLETDTSDSMDESDGSSDFLSNESVENSDTEDMNVQE